MQQGAHVAKTILNDFHGEARQPFEYNDRGIMATIGRKRAVVQTGKLKLWGLAAWVSWLGLHVWYLIGFRTKLLVMLEWTWAYVSNSRGARFVEAQRDPTSEFGVTATSPRESIIVEKPKPPFAASTSTESSAAGSAVRAAGANAGQKRLVTSSQLPGIARVYTT